MIFILQLGSCSFSCSPWGGLLLNHLPCNFLWLKITPPPGNRWPDVNPNFLKWRLTWSHFHLFDRCRGIGEIMKMSPSGFMSWAAADFTKAYSLYQNMLIYSFFVVVNQLSLPWKQMEICLSVLIVKHRHQWVTRLITKEWSIFHSVSLPSSSWNKKSTRLNTRVLSFLLQQDTDIIQTSRCNDTLILHETFFRATLTRVWTVETRRTEPGSFTMSRFYLLQECAMRSSSVELQYYNIQQTDTVQESRETIRKFDFCIRYIDFFIIIDFF